MIVLNAELLSGGERYALELALAFNEIGWNAQIACPAGSLVESAARDAGLAVRPLNLPPKLGRKTALKAVMRSASAVLVLRRLAQSVGPRGVIILQYKLEELLWSSSASRTVLLEHGPLPKSLVAFPLTRRRWQSVAKRAQSVYAVSQVAARSIEDLGIRVQVLPPVVGRSSVERAIALRSDTRDQWYLPPDDRVALYIGRLNWNKGLDSLLNVATEVPPGWSLFVAGSGPDARRLSEQVAQRGLSQQIRLLGQVADGLRLIAAADLVLVPTRDPGEGRPLVVTEAVACGTPVLGNVFSDALKELASEFGDDRVLLTDFEDPRNVARTMRQVQRRPALAPPRLRDWRQLAYELADAWL